MRARPRNVPTSGAPRRAARRARSVSKASSSRKAPSADGAPRSAASTPKRPGPPRGGRCARGGSPRRRPASAPRAAARCTRGPTLRSAQASPRRTRGARARRPDSPTGRSTPRARRTCRIRLALIAAVGLDQPRTAGAEGDTREQSAQPLQQLVLRLAVEDAVEIPLERVEHREAVAVHLVADLVDESRVAVDRGEVCTCRAADEQRRDREVLARRQRQDRGLAR